MNTFRHNCVTACHLLLICAVGVLIYSNTLTSAFQFDDKLNIVDNLFIRDVGNLWPPSGARWFGLLTFSLNYLAGGTNPVGYHLVNISIHIFTALSVYLFVLLTFKTPYFSNYRVTAIPGKWLAFACGLLFVAHPIQTQAVTYIVQRFASLATQLFMLSLDLYILARLSAKERETDPYPVGFRSHGMRATLYVASLLFAVLSLRTKEIAYTLPVVAVLYDVMFISSLPKLLATLRKRWLVVAGLSGMTLAFLAVAINRRGLQALFDTFKATNEISRHDYLITQFRVIVTYLRLLLVPVNQTIDHHYRVYNSVLAPQIVASMSVVALLLVAGCVLYKISSHGSPVLRLASFGIFWFFITLSIESSIIPIIDVMFEHRLYLPSIGAILAVTAAVLHALENPSLNPGQARKAAACILAVTVISLSCAAHARNRVWKSEFTLWTDVIAKNPLNPRGYNMVGSYYQANFRIYDAIGYFRKALEVDSTYAEARSNLGNAYIQIGRVDEGLNELMITSKNNRFDEIDTGILYYNIGKGQLRKGLTDAAIETLNMSLRLIPNEPAVYGLLSEAFQRKNMPEQSAAYLRKAHDLDPGKY